MHLPRAAAPSLAVLIATRGRPQIVADLVRSLLHEQTRPPDAVIVIAARAEDMAAIDRSDPRVTVSIGREGSSCQRNDALAIAGGRFTYVVFFDDDFIPARSWLQRAEQLFEAHPDLASLTGTVLADGMHGPGIPHDEALAIVRADESVRKDSDLLHFGAGPYGCNMAFRTSAIADTRFDERLPLYAWLEDSDFGGQIRDRGRQARAEALRGVHLGHKAGKQRGVILGYSQIVNAYYLARKGTLPPRWLARIAIGNFVRNCLRSLAPEAHIDRRGRLRGNLIGLADLLRGRATPERAAEL